MLSLDMWEEPFTPLTPRHDGHKQKAQGYYRRNNDIVKYSFWVIVALIVVFLALCRLSAFSSRKRCTQPTDSSATYASLNGHNDHLLHQQEKSRPQRATSIHFQKYAGLYRRISYPRLVFTGRWSRHFSPPSQGECLFLCLYWLLISAMLWTNVFFKSLSGLYGIEWEVVGFRAGWVSTTQFPLIYATCCKINPISLLTGITRERLNWFHRWVARTVFMTLIVHWAFFYREWDLAHFVKQEIETMPMVIWGFAAWAAIGLMVITGFGWFRDWCYEVWLVSHIVLAWAVLGLSYKHTHCTTYFVGASLGLLLFDLLGRVTLWLVHNIHLLSARKSLPSFGHNMSMEVLNDDYIRLEISDPAFTWKAGQHIYLNVPRIHWFESHPFTISSVSSSKDSAVANHVTLIVKAQLGFTKQLLRRASRPTPKTLRVFIQGPYGNPPAINHNDIVIFITTGNRASFTVPLLQDLLQQPAQVSKILFHFVVPNQEIFIWYKDQLMAALGECKLGGIEIQIQLHITRNATRRPLLGSLAAVRNWPDDVFDIGRDSSESSRSTGSSRTLTTDGTSSPAFKLQELKDRASPPSPLSLQSSVGLKEDEEIDDQMALLEENRPKETEGKSFTGEENEEGSLCVGMDGPSELTVLHGRPTTRDMLHPAILDAGSRDRIMIVAATSAPLGAEIANCCSRLLGQTGCNGASGRVLELWCETNGV